MNLTKRNRKNLLTVKRITNEQGSHAQERDDKDETNSEKNKQDKHFIKKTELYSKR